MRFAMYPITRTFTSIAVIAALLSAPLATRAEEASAGAVVGFENPQGKTMFLHDFKGKPVLINLWATWCAPCVEELPSLEKLQQDYAAKGLTILTLSEDDSADLPIAFYNLKKVTALTPYFDKGHAVYTALTAKGLPTTIFVSRDGKMLNRIEGPVDWNSPKVRPMVDMLVK